MHFPKLINIKNRQKHSTQRNDKTKFQQQQKKIITLKVKFFRNQEQIKEKGLKFKKKIEHSGNRNKTQEKKF